MKRTKSVFHMILRKCKRAKENISRNKIVDACLNNNGDLFKELKKMRSSSQNFAKSMDGETRDIPGHFHKIYSQLYNSVEDDDENARLAKEIEESICCNSMLEVDKVSPSIIKEASKRLKNHKSDPYYKFSSDCLK